jgi:hypothetical protein
MKFKKPSDLLLIAFGLLLPVAAMAQGNTEEDLKDYFSSVMLVTGVREDSTYISGINDRKKLSADEKKQRIAAHREQVAQYNDNLVAAANYWNGDKKLVVPDESNEDYILYGTNYAKATEEKVKDITLYYLSYTTTPLISGAEPIFGGAQRPAIALIERNLSTGSGKIVTMVLMSQGVPSAGLLGCYFNALDAQMNDAAKGITYKDEPVFETRMKELKDKTLLIPEQFLSGKLTKESIAQIYPYAFEILDKNEMDAKLQSEERDKCVIYQIIPQAATTRSGGGMSQTAVMYKSALFDAYSGRRMDIQEIKLSLAGSSGTDELTTKELKKMVSQIE